MPPTLRRCVALWRQPWFLGASGRCRNLRGRRGQAADGEQGRQIAFLRLGEWAVARLVRGAAAERKDETK